MCTSSESGFVTMTLAITYLTFLQTDFQIYQLIEKVDPLATTSLIETASEVVAIVSDLSLVRRKAGLNVADCSYVVWMHSLYFDVSDE